MLARLTGSGTGALNFTVFFRALLWGMTFFFLPLMLAGYGLTGIEIGALFSILVVMSILSTFPIGVLNDRASIKAATLLGLLLLSLYYLLLSSASSFWLLVPVFVLGGLASNMFETSALSMVFKSMGIFNRGKKLGIYYLASSIGSGSGLLMGGLLLFNFDFRAVLMATSALFLLVFAASLSLPGVKVARFPMMLYKELFMRKRVLLLVIPLVLFSTHWGAEHTSYSLFLRDNLGLGMLASGLYMGIPILALGIFAYISGMRIDKKRSSRSVFFAGLLLSGIFHALMTIPSVWLSFAFRIIHEIGDAAVTVSYSVMFAGLFPKKTIAGNAGMMRVTMVAGNIIGCMVFGPIGYAWGYAWPFIISGAMAVLSAFALLASGKYLAKV
jgi:MFS family permease